MADKIQDAYESSKNIYDGVLTQGNFFSRMYIKSDFTLSEFYQEIIEDELNVKEVVFTDDVRD